MRLSYPLRPQDVTKLLDRAFDKAVTLTKPFQSLVKAVHGCAMALESLAGEIAVVKHNQAVLQNAITHMHQLQQFLMMRLGEHAMDVSLPDIDVPKPPKPEDEVAVRKAKAALKPN